MSGPLSGIRVVELAGIGPGPHAAMILADLGADVVRVVRPSDVEGEQAHDTHTLRRRTFVAADLKSDLDAELVRELVDRADILIEGFRPGVAERLGLGPDDLRRRNPRLIYARMTGWGQTGPWAAMAGHDINYMSITGLLSAIGQAERPVPPLNLVGDYGGGSMFLLVGVLAGLIERGVSGEGQIIDAAMVDGVSMLGQPIWELRALGMWDGGRESNLLDGGAPFYRTYRCSDGGFIAVGCIEPQFYVLFLDGVGLTGEELPDQNDTSRWSELHARFEAVIGAEPRGHWEHVFEGTDACVSPVLGFDEVSNHPHMAARGSVAADRGVLQASAAPRFSRTSEASPWSSRHRSAEYVRDSWDERGAPADGAAAVSAACP